MSKTRTKYPLLQGFSGTLKVLHRRLEERRGKPVPLELIVRRLERIGPHLSLGVSTLWRWMEGEVQSPDPLILRELAGLYGTDYAALLAVLDANRRNPRLSTEEAVRVLESHRAGSVPEVSAPFDSGGIAPESVLETAAQLIDLGDQITELGIELVRRQTAALGLTPSGPAVRDRRHSHALVGRPVSARKRT